MINKDSQVLFNLLIDSFSLPISLRMISGREGGSDAKVLIEVTKEVRVEHRSTIRHGLFWEPMMLPDFFEIEIRSSFSINGLGARDEVSSTSMRVDDDKDRVLAFALR